MVKKEKENDLDGTLLAPTPPTCLLRIRREQSFIWRLSLLPGSHNEALQVEILCTSALFSSFIHSSIYLSKSKQAKIFWKPLQWALQFDLVNLKRSQGDRTLNALKFSLNHMRMYESFVLGFRKGGASENFELLEPDVVVNTPHSWLTSPGIPWCALTGLVWLLFLA